MKEVFIILPEQTIDVKIVPKNFEHFKKIGYNPIMGKIISVSPSELPTKSKKIEKRICDRCNNEYSRKRCFNMVTLEIWGKDLCTECLKSKEYREKILEKMRRTTEDRYGVYGVGLQVKEIQDKQKTTMKERYGKEFPGQVEDFINKKNQTNLERYGNINPAASEEILEKMRKTLYENQSCPTSSQQIKLKKMIENILPDTKIELNYPFSRVQLDIGILYNDDIKIDVEYDAWFWHQDEQKDRRRDEFLKENGFKILRIKSGHKLPTLEQVEEKIKKLLEEDRKYEEIILDDWNNNF